MRKNILFLIFLKKFRWIRWLIFFRFDCTANNRWTYCNCKSSEKMCCDLWFFFRKNSGRRLADGFLGAPVLNFQKSLKNEFRTYFGRNCLEHPVVVGYWMEHPVFCWMLFGIGKHMYALCMFSMEKFPLLGTDRKSSHWQEILLLIGNPAIDMEFSLWREILLLTGNFTIECSMYRICTVYGRQKCSQNRRKLV